MATFQVLEDSPRENIEPLDKIVKGKNFVEKDTERRALQVLGNVKQNKIKNTKVLPTKQTSTAPVIKHQSNHNQKKEDKNDGNRTKNQRPQITSSDMCSYQPPAVTRKRGVLHLVSASPLEEEYEDDIWNYLLNRQEKCQKVKVLYMSKQLHINWDMRSVLIDWLVSVAEEYQLENQTIHLSVNYLDRFLSNISVVREKFQLVGATAMLLAGKVEEIYPPNTKEWAFLTGDAYTVRQILKMEQLMLKVLNFEMQPPTALDFIRHLCARNKIDTKTMYLAMYLSEMALLEGRDYLKYVPSKVASASVALARHTLFKTEPWSKRMEESAGYSLKQLSPVVQKQQDTFKGSPFREQQSIQKKYASDKFERVALLRPRILVLDGGEDEE